LKDEFEKRQNLFTAKVRPFKSVNFTLASFKPVTKSALRQPGLFSDLFSKKASDEQELFKL
jgi:hypothetical protein